MYVVHPSFHKRAGSDHGFSLLEAMIAIALVAVVAFALMAWVSNSVMGLNNITQNTEVTNTMLRAVSSFGDANHYCKDNLGGKVFNPADPAGTQIGAIDFYDSNDVKVSNVLTLGQPIPQAKGIAIADIRLKPSVNISAQNVLANLEFTFAKSNVLGPTAVVRKIPVYLSLAGGVVTNCATSPVLSMTISNRFCEAGDDGFSHYEEVGDQCIDNANVKWFKSTDPTTAVCPAGYKGATYQVAIGANKNICHSISSVGYPLPPRTYSNGFTADNPSSLFTTLYTPSSSTCNFYFVTGDDITTYTSSIKCYDPAGATP
jgi:prepilin-type N-terminal cleavage/methylation domain-containing protein